MIMTAVAVVVVVVVLLLLLEMFVVVVVLAMVEVVVVVAVVYCSQILTPSLTHADLVGFPLVDLHAGGGGGDGGNCPQFQTIPLTQAGQIDLDGLCR